MASGADERSLLAGPVPRPDALIRLATARLARPVL